MPAKVISSLTTFDVKQCRGLAERKFSWLLTIGRSVIRSEIWRGCTLAERVLLNGGSRCYFGFLRL